MKHLPMVIVMVPHEWVERSQLHPADTQFSGSVTSKPTDISSHKWNPKQLEIQNTWQKQQPRKKEEDHITKTKKHTLHTMRAFMDEDC